MKELSNHIDAVERKINYQFNNLDLLHQAFTRRSHSTQYGYENNEVLEFIGDAVLDFYIVKIMIERYGYTKSNLGYFNDSKDYDEFCIKAHKNEQSFTELKKELVSNKFLAKVIDKLRFSKMMYLGEQDIKNEVWNNEKVKADLCEAIIGAIAIDSDWDNEKIQDSLEYMLNIDDFLEDVDEGIERPKDCSIENSINTLKELAESGQCSMPEYYQYEAKNNNNPRLKWACECKVRSWGKTWIANATSKKLAKKYSAYLALCDKFELENEYQENDVKAY